MKSSHEDRERSPNSLIDNPYLFTGRRFDQETGLYYYRARYYDADQGRFISRDPLGYLDGMNLYEYVGSNPINSVDPLGLAEGCKYAWFGKKVTVYGYSISWENCVKKPERKIEITHSTKVSVIGIGALIWDAGFWECTQKADRLIGGKINC
ncbi:MAG: RHS repeat-associated core domain-containing protein [Crocosphaera sp.]|nr:RHS repeat-associated core domain-containing protein [Crocosphaera sp.]